jgi:mevalonate kinase
VEGYAPGKVVLFGEHATVYNYPGITAAIDIGLRVRIERDEDGPRFLNPDFRQAFDVPESDRDIRLFSRAVDEALEAYAMQREPIAVGVESQLVPGMGLGSSAAFSAALISALRTYRGEAGDLSLAGDFFRHVQKLEHIFHGHPSGMDAATVLSEGVIWFRKGPPREIVPIRMPREMRGVVCIVEPGARTIDMVQSVRASRDLNRKRVDTILEEIGQVTSDAGIALGTGDAPEVGRLMYRNHELLGRLGVSTPELDRAVETLLEHDALGAKLTGSGGGGAVIGLFEGADAAHQVERLRESFPMVFPFSVRSPA